jgi:hypothetical protein
MVSCNLCNRGLDEDPGLDPTLREPCPNCGSTSRRFAVDIFESVFGYASISTVITLAQDRVNDAQAPSSGISKALPRTGELLLYVFLTRAERVNVIGDLIEDYHEAIHKFGRRTATKCFYLQVFRSLWPFLRKFLLRIGIISFALKLLTWIVDAIGRLAGR